MQKPAVRLSFFALLLVTGIGAGYVILDTYRRVSDLLEIELDVDTRLDHMSAAVAALGASQQAYVAPGQQRGEALTRATILVQQLYDETAALRRIARSSEAAPSLLAFGQTVDALVRTDDRARDQLRDGEDLMASDLVYTEARQAVDSMVAQVGELRTAERTAAAVERQALLMRGGSVLGAAGLVWLMGLLMLVQLPRPATTVEAEAPATIAPVTPDERAPEQTVDLAAAAEICTDLSRLSSATSLSDVLARAARVLDASGAIVWLGAGEELFAASAYGYPTKTLARLGPIPRAADNATAAAWRTSEMCIVTGGPTASGAIAAPLFGPHGCCGVLAVEMPAGREHDAVTRAVTAMIAAQLSTTVAPWPVPSRTEAPASNENDIQPHETASGSAEQAVVGA